MFDGKENDYLQTSFPDLLSSVDPLAASLSQWATALGRPPLGQQGHAQRRRSPAPVAPALEPDEAALVVAPLSAEQTEHVTGRD